MLFKTKFKILEKYENSENSTLAVGNEYVTRFALSGCFELVTKLRECSFNSDTTASEIGISLR